MLILFFSLLLSFSAQAADSFSPIISKPRGSLASLDPMNAEDFAKILDRLGSALLWKPYKLGPLGEGPGAEHPEPLYRIDAFDCTTFIETVMTNAYCFRANSRMQECLSKRMREIRYAGERVLYSERNHIPELDWLPNNVNRGFLEDLQSKIFPAEWKSAVITIDRELWLSSRTRSGMSRSKVGKTLSKLAFLPISFFFKKVELKSEEKKALEEKLSAEQKEIAERRAAPTLKEEDLEELAKKKFRSELAYLRAVYVPVEERLAQIPSGTVLSLLRTPPKSKTKAKILSLVSHQGLIVQRSDGPHILHAAANVGHVSDQPLGEYLFRFVRSGNYRGISFYRILPGKGL